MEKRTVKRLKIVAAGTALDNGTYFMSEETRSI